jgi:hypothetical protein
MPLQFGRSGFIKLGEESSYGSAASLTVDNRIVSATLAESQERSRKTFLSQSSAAFSTGHFDNFLVVGGSVELPLLYEGSGLLIKAAMGSVSTTGAGPSYTHTFTPSATLPSLTCELQRGTGSSEKFLGCMISSLSFSGSAGEEIMMSVEFIAQDANSRAGSASSTFGSGRQVFHFEAGTLSFGGNTYNVRSFECTIDNKLERRQVLGDKKTLEPAINDVREAMFNLTLEMEDDNLYNAQLADTTSDAILIFSNSDSDSITFTLKNAYITDYSDPVNTFGALERTVTLMGESDSSNEAISIVIVNQQSSAVAN